MLSLGAILRRMLARRGYVLSRVEGEIPPTVAAHLRSRQIRGTSALSVVCFDNEVLIQAEIIEAMGENAVVFSSPLFDTASGATTTGSALPPTPFGRFVAVVDIDVFSIEVLLTRIPWLKKAEALLLRTRLGSFWTGKIDLGRLEARVLGLGFHFSDFIASPSLSSLQTPSERAFVVCESGGVAPSAPIPQRRRVIEALTWLSSPIVERGNFQLLAGRGSFNFAAGVYNPGAIVESEKTFLLARADRIPWVLQKTDASRFFASAQPLLLTLCDNNGIAHATELPLEGLPDPAVNRAEDFRLFRYRGHVFSNHAVISNPRICAAAHKPLRLDLLQTRIGISRLDLKAKRLTWCGSPVVDRPLAQTEKNWVVFPDADRLLLLYSFSPYVLLSCSNWSGLEFSTILETRFPLPFDGDGLPIRNSINPVDYDKDHWLHVVHKVYPGKQYSSWAVLLDKQSLCPVQVTARPLVCGWRSTSASIIYACSVIVRRTEILLFSGLDDSATAVATIPRTRLDAEWMAISPKLS